MASAENGPISTCRLSDGMTTANFVLRTLVRLLSFVVVFVPSVCSGVRGPLSRTGRDTIVGETENCLGLCGRRQIIYTRLKSGFSDWEVFISLSYGY